MKRDLSKAVPSPLTDDSPMPWGKYKGYPMRRVPASYFHWLWTKGELSDDRVYEYISKNKSALEEENEDLIWD